MSVFSNLSKGRVIIGLFVFLAVTLISSPGFAQSDSNPKWDLFVGYQYLHPGGTVPSPFGDPSNPVPTAFTLPDSVKGGGVALTYNFDPHWGLEFDWGHNWNDTLLYEDTSSVGPRFMWRTEGANLFLHSLLSLNRVKVTELGGINGIGAILGGGMDIPFTKHFAWRAFEADYVWGRHNYSDFADPNFPALRRVSLEGIRLRTGLVFSWGGAPEVTPAASCSVQPAEVIVGEPITATVVASNFNPKHTLTYAWSGNGGQVTGKETTAQIDTTGATPGSYSVSAHVTDTNSKKAEANCSANYTIKPLPPKNPPTMTCSASPSSVQAGASVTVTCSCSSPDGVTVSVANWTANAGSISGSGRSAILNTAGAPSGSITVGATCTDARGLSTSANANVMVENPPPPPPPPMASKLSQCDFPNPVKPWRVDNTCKAILDDVAKNLQQNPDNKLVVVGNAEPKEKRKNLAAERAVNSKYYLVEGEAQQHIDASRIEVRTGSGGTKTAEYWIVPSGATFDSAGTQTVDESKVKNVPDHPKPAAKKAAKKKSM